MFLEKMVWESFLLGLFAKIMFKIFGKKPPALAASNPELVKAPLSELSQEEFDKAKLKARIAFVDDEEVNYIKRLGKDGYNVVYWEDIENIDDFARKGYHVVILDIQGIGKTISESTEGWGILKYLKKTYPHIVVVMFTGADWSISKFKQQADQADDFIGKDSEYLDFKYSLDNAIKKAFSPKYHLAINKKHMMQVLQGAESPEEILGIIENYGRDKETAVKKLKEVTSNGEIIKAATEFLTLVNSIFDLAK